MAKIIVIGAGIVGTNIAYELMQKGDDVTIIDAEINGRATAAGAGIIAPWANQRRNKDWYLLAKNGAAYYPDLIEQLKEDNEKMAGYKKVGSLQLYKEKEKSEKMLKIVQKKREDAPEIGAVEIFSEKETQTAFPLVNEGYHALYIEGATRVDGRVLRDSILRAAMRRGAKYMYGKARLLNEHTVTLKDEVMKADAIVLANGVWMNDSLKSLGIETNMYMQKGQLIHVYSPELAHKDYPIVNIPSDPYIVPFGNGRFVIGATREDDVPMDTRNNLKAIHELFEKTFTFADGFKNSELLEVRTGFRPFTPSFIPSFGLVPNTESVYFANGLGSSGLTTGPYVGSLLAQTIHGECPIDISPYNLKQYMK